MEHPRILKVFKEYDRTQIVILIFFSLFSLLNIYSLSSDSTMRLLIRQLLFILFFWLIVFLINKIPLKVFHLFSFSLYAITLPIILLTIFSPFFFTNPRTIDFSFIIFDVAPFASVMMILSFPSRISKVITKQGTFYDFFKQIGIPLIIIYMLLLLIDSTYATCLLFVFLIIFWIFFRFTYLMKFIAILFILTGSLFASTYLVNTARSNIARERIQNFITGEDIQNNSLAKTYNEVLTQKVKEGGLWGVGPIVKNDSIEYQSTYLDIIYQYGIIGGILVLLLYLLFIFNSIKNILKNVSINTLILQLSIILYFSILAFVHILSSIGVLPFVNLELPFISTEGRNLLFYAILIGILFKKNYKDEIL